ncbi:MAG: hypothetical protein K5651_08045 [Bacteroidales bacterium]|nr:hypothetical protein [Bacteroidales bacterium]
MLASCAKEQAIQNENVLPDGQGTPAGVTTLTVGLTEPEALAPQNTKTHMDIVVMENKHKVYWSNGDQIAVNGVSSKPLSEIPEYSQTADFNFDAVLSTPYSIVYPASIYADATHVALPAIQDYRAGGFAEGMYPMAGCSADGQGITLGYPCAMVKISVLRAAADADEDNLIAVRFKGRNDEQVCGSFAIDYETATLTGTSTAAADKEVRVIKTMETSTASACVYYVVVPAGTYSNGFDIIVQDINGHIMTQSKTEPVTLAAGHLYAMPEFAFVPTATELGVEIANAQDLIQFATDYNNEVYVPLGDALVATLTSDITFDAETSAAFNATGGIASVSSTNYFHGVFNGADYTISGLSATVPLFAAIGSSGIAKNFTMDNTCSFTFTHPNTAELDAGAVVGYHKGLLEDVNVEADVAIQAGEISKVTALGGLAGRVTTGTIDNCSYSGNLSVPDGFAVSAQKTYIGGLVGSITNADGKVQNSEFEGTIDFAGIVASTSTSDPYLRLGGIVGTVNAGTVSGCSVSGTSTKAIEMDNGTIYTATIQNHSRKVYHMAQGGIVGYNAGTVSSSTNNASTKNFVLSNAAKGETADDNNSRYYDVGGIVGLNTEDGTVTGCTNNGLFESRSTPRIQKIGGIVGYNNKGRVSSCSNSEAGDIVIASATGQSPYSLRVGEIGGAIGNNGGTISNIQNAGDITLSRTENNAGVEMKFGGVIGFNSAAIDGGADKKISNSGNIAITYNPVTVTTAGLRYGGIVGSTQASIQNVSNTGNVTYTLSAANVMSKLYMGGIAGEVRNKANVTVSGSNNNGNVYFNVNGKAAAHTGDYIGGIIGFVTPDEDAEETVTTTVSDCENSGYVQINCNITTACMDLIAAGVVGQMNESGSITDCDNVGGASNAGEVYIAFSDAAHTDNYAGGIVGKTVNSDLAISGCANSGYIHGGNSKKRNGTNMYVGGIAAYLSGDSAIGGCVNSGNVYNDQFVNSTSTTNAFTGGIAAFVMGADGSPIAISNCEHKTANLASRRGYQGGIVGYANYVSLSDSDNNASFLGGSVYCSGGIAGWVQNGSITRCDFTGASIYSSQILANSGGGIAAKLDATLVDGCQSSVTDIYHTDSSNVKDADVAGGAIVGISGSGNTIQNCRFKSTINGVASNIAGTGTFTDGGGNVADL